MTVTVLAAGSVPGFNVTTPIKEAVIAACDTLTTTAADAGAVNTVRIEAAGMIGHNTDGLGLVAALHDLWRIDVAGARACVLGSGPAARSGW